MKLPILLYHKIDRIPPGARYPRSYVTPERFDAQLALLRRCGYESVSFADYLAYRRGGAGPPPRPPPLPLRGRRRRHPPLPRPPLPRPRVLAPRLPPSAARRRAAP